MAKCVPPLPPCDSVAPASSVKCNLGLGHRGDHRGTVPLQWGEGVNRKALADMAASVAAELEDFNG